MLIPYFSSGGNGQSWYKSYAESALEYLILRDIQISGSGSMGGYLSIFEPRPDNQPPKIEYVIACGEFKPKKERYFYLSHEKAFRLNEKLPAGHKTSRQSVNEEQEEFAGAMYFDEEKRIFSFSGLYPEWDEFFSVFTSCFLHYLRNNRYPEYISLEDVPKLFKQRMGQIVTSKKRTQKIMMDTMNWVVAKEIRNRDKK